MTRRRNIQGVLPNFLGTYTSRYSDFDGYWIFGFLVEGIGETSFDLLDASSECAEATEFAFARRLAVRKFAEQLAKAGLPKSWFREARLDISKSAESKSGFVNGRSCSGYDLRFLAHAVTDLGSIYKSTASIFVAPHDPRMERRSIQPA
jgi:hypothetical protein